MGEGEKIDGDSHGSKDERGSRCGDMLRMAAYGNLRFEIFLIYFFFFLIYFGDLIVRKV